MKAMLIVGMQVDILPGSPAEVPGSQELIYIINEWQPEFDLVVAANFHLPANHITFAGNHLWRYPGQVINLEGKSILLRPIFGVPGTFGAEFMPGLQTSRLAFIAEMGASPLIPPHSAFFDIEKQRATGLLDFLRTKKVEALYIAGVPLEDEVKHSALDSLQAGFDTFLIKNACKGRTPEATHSTFIELESAGVKLVGA